MRYVRLVEHKFGTAANATATIWNLVDLHQYNENIWYCRWWWWCYCWYVWMGKTCRMASFRFGSLWFAFRIFGAYLAPNWMMRRLRNTNRPTIDFGAFTNSLKRKRIWRERERARDSSNFQKGEQTLGVVDGEIKLVTGDVSRGRSFVRLFVLYYSLLFCCNNNVLKCVEFLLFTCCCCCCCGGSWLRRRRYCSCFHRRC